MKRSVLCFACSALMAVCLSGAPRAQEARPPAERGPSQEQQLRGGIVTLYALDPLARAFCLHDGREDVHAPQRPRREAVRRPGLHLAGGGTLVIGPEANRVVALVDLGTASDIRTRYGFDDASGMDIGFGSLRLFGGKLTALVQKEDRPQEKVEPLKEAQALSSPRPRPTCRSASVTFTSCGSRMRKTATFNCWPSLW